MKMVGAAICTAAAAGATAFLVPSVAEAAALQCVSVNGDQSMQIEDAAACGSVAGGSGRAAAYALDGIGYANADGTASSLGLGIAGGVGASEGASGVPTAFGIGPDAVAITSTDDGSFSISVAFTESRAVVTSGAAGVECAGPAAFAWNSHSGRGCVATGVGIIPIG